MKTTVSQYQFIDAFSGSQYNNNFTYNGKLALYDYLTQLEKGCDMEIELDICALSCEYSEYGCIEDCYQEYNDDYNELGEDDEERDEKAKEWLEDRTTVIEVE